MKFQLKTPKFKRPEIKVSGVRGRGPEVHLPSFITDVYADLRDRRLLPLVALLIVAIAAVPFLLGGSSKEHGVTAVPNVAGNSVNTASLSVVPAGTELQEYKKRLDHRRTVNPFNPYSATKHPTPAPKAKRAAAPVSEEPSEVGSATPGETGGTGGTSSTTIVTKPVVKANITASVGVTAEVKAGFVGSELKPYELEPQTQLPQGKTAIVYTGYSKKGGALFLMTSAVSEFVGDGSCVLGGGSACQVVEVKPKGSEVFRIGYGETRYKVIFLGFESVVEEGLLEWEDGKKERFQKTGKHSVSGKGGSGAKGKSAGSRNGGGGSSTGDQPAPRWLVRHEDRIGLALAAATAFGSHK
jgi:uncharacterized membrane protein YgcG